MAVLIDTSVLIDAERRSGTLDRSVGQQERAISVITASELLHGVHRATEDGIRLRREAFVEYVLSSIEALPITSRVSRVHAGIWSALQREGLTVSAHDLWIAATALSYGMSVATANARDFGRVPGLTVVPV